MKFLHVEGLYRAPYVYFIVVADHIYINIATELPFGIWQKEITTESLLTTRLSFKERKIYNDDEIQVYCCQCNRLNKEKEVTHLRLLTGVGIILSYCCTKKLSNHETITPLESSDLRVSLRPSEKTWIQKYALDIFNMFEKKLLSTSQKFSYQMFSN